MLLPSANINTNKSFGNPQDLTLLTSDDLSLDHYECCWGLNRGELDAYRKGPANHLHLQPALKTALKASRIAILPSDDILHQLLDLQNSNDAVRLQDRRLFFEKVPFGTYEYRVIPLKGNINMYAKDPVTQTITRRDTSSFTISSSVHPFFLVAYVATVIQQHLPALDRDLRRLLVQIWGRWAVLPCLEFVEGSYEGEFGRRLSFRYMRRRFPIPSVPSLTSASTSTYSTCSSRSSSKCLCSSSPAVEEDDIDVDIHTWVARCDPNDFDPVVDNDADVGSYRFEAAKSLADAVNAKLKAVPAPNTRNPKRKRA